ncbi:hypothetical protein AFULGI_00001720 [Archaeoglobus fulgidus DSM 8774]|jgi:hypothetical protein|uniref:Uncharacterized protein n=1 Tax=Archaeoglobus fulgidus DSM 8774 TaxID=1344584 RepID=A0A075WHF6_ARCFL|nr:hypothetical protein AFULGI_00001720 [Archaeoglobus fulgidus DSM 8774]
MAWAEVTEWVVKYGYRYGYDYNNTPQQPVQQGYYVTYHWHCPDDVALVSGHSYISYLSFLKFFKQSSIRAPCTSFLECSS